MSYGRLTFPTILSLSGLSARELKHSLVVLVQQHLALWYTPADEDTTYYEANWTNAYALVRSGKLIKMVEDCLGEFAGGLISNLFLLGHAQIGDLARAYNIEPLESIPSLPNRMNSANGLGKTHVKDPSHTSESFHSTLYKLIQSGYVSVVSQSHFRSKADNRYEAEKEVKRNTVYQGPMKRDQKLEYEHAVEQKLTEWKFNSEVEGKVIEIFEKASKRRLDNGDYSISDRSGKRMRLDSDSQNWANGTTFSSERSSHAALDVCFDCRKSR